MANGRLTLVGESDKRPSRIHHLVKAPANTPWAQEKNVIFHNFFYGAVGDPVDLG